MSPILRAAFICCFLTVAGVVLPSAGGAASVEIGDRLAYVTGGQLYVGFPHGTLIPGQGDAWQPRFSFDGRWLAFVRRPRAVRPQLWLAEGDGSGARRLTVHGGVGEFSWSPTADVLAVQPVTGKGYAPVVLMSPDGGGARCLTGSRVSFAGRRMGGRWRLPRDGLGMRCWMW